MLTIQYLTGYTIPHFGNERTLPYGKLCVKDDLGNEKEVDIKETPGGDQHFTFNRKRYYVKNVGMLWNPIFKIVDND